MQGVVKSYDPSTGIGVVIRDTDLAEIDLAANALEGTLFRMLRQGQRLVFELDAAGHAIGVGIGAEGDMDMPVFPEALSSEIEMPQL